MHQKKNNLILSVVFFFFSFPFFLSLPLWDLHSPDGFTASIHITLATRKKPFHYWKLDEKMHTKKNIQFQSNDRLLKHCSCKEESRILGTGCSEGSNLCFWGIDYPVTWSDSQGSESNAVRAEQKDAWCQLGICAPAVMGKTPPHFLWFEMWSWKQSMTVNTQL